VQDTFVHHRRASTEDLRSPPSYLTAGVINLRQDGFTGMEPWCL
jgi:hypothetical protein